MLSQNKYDAAMSQRASAKDALDDFPTPPWATRALAEHVIAARGTCLEPACGRGHMSATLAEYFDHVHSSDIFDYGFGTVASFLQAEYKTESYDWVITNPPFNLAEDFINRSLKIARRGIAMLTRTVFIESAGRYTRLFEHNRPSKVAQFVERVPMVVGRLDRKASTATGYAWLVWQRDQLGSCELVWIPPCRKKLERNQDYDVPPINWKVYRRPPVDRVNDDRIGL